MSMPLRKRLQPISDYKDYSKNPKTDFIQQYNSLLSLAETNLTLPELKILDVYLCSIDSNNIKERTIQFEKGEIERILGISKILKHDLEKRLRHLGQVVEIEDESKPEGFKLISLFEEINAWRDDDGLWQISLTCTSSAKKYIFNAENIGYLRYRLKNVISLKSRYSYVLYMWLEYNRFRGTWDIEVTELKALLRCTADTYKEFKRFNDLILKRCQKEIHEKTNCRFSYTPIRRGRFVKIIRFTVETLPNIETSNPNEITLENYYQDNDHIELLRSACCPSGTQIPEFSRAEIEQVFEVLLGVPDRKLPMISGGINIQRYHYLAERYAAMNRIDEKKPIKNRFSYFLKIIKADAGME